MAEGEKRLSALFVEPADPLPVAASWELVVSKSLSNSSGQASLGRDQVVKLGSVLPFAVESSTGHTSCDRPYHIDVICNKRLKAQGAGRSPEESKAAQASMLAGLVELVVVGHDLGCSRVGGEEERGGRGGGGWGGGRGGEGSTKEDVGGGGGGKGKGGGGGGMGGAGGHITGCRYCRMRWIQLNQGQALVWGRGG